MAVTGTVKTENSGNFSKKIGLGAFQICGVNLSYEELKEKGFYVKDEDLSKDRDFIGERDGVTTVMLEFALKEVGKSHPLMKKISFFLADEDRESKNNSGSFQWINAQGNTSYARSKDALRDWFKKYD